MMAAPLIFSASAPVCVPPPAGVCITVCPPGCICPAVVNDCGPKAVPMLNDLMILLVVLAVILVGYLGLRGKL